MASEGWSEHLGRDCSANYSRRQFGYHRWSFLTCANKEIIQVLRMDLKNIKKLVQNIYVITIDQGTNEL